MIPVHRSPGIYLGVEEIPGKPQLEDCQMKALRPVMASSGIIYLKMKSVGSHSTLGREKEGNKETTVIILIGYHQPIPSFKVHFNNVFLFSPRLPW